MTSHVLCDCEALAALRFIHLDRRFMKPGDWGNLCWHILRYVQGAGLLRTRMNTSAAQRISMVEVHGSLLCPPFCIIFYWRFGGLWRFSI